MTNESSQIIVDAPNSYPPWAPRIWTGFLPPQYWSYLAENRFAIHPARYPMTALVGFWTMLNTVLAGIQKFSCGGKVQQTNIAQPPIFIVGHWRSGTTLLHELMSMDDQLAYPSNFDAFVPNHFLVSGPLMRPLIRALLPSKRPMDNMTVDVDSPQEDDFALMILGAASQYRRMGFPQNKNEYYRWLDAANLDAAALDIVRENMNYFYQALTFKYGKRLVLKSPPHTGRLKFLADWFPGAKFVHISRHPYSVVPSTMRLWMIADDVHAFHPRRYDQLELLEYVNCCQQYMYDAYFRDREQIPSEQIIEVKFEDLTANPVETMQRIYGQLDLDGMDRITESTRQYFQNKKGHKKNRHNVAGITDVIDRHWERYIDAFCR